MIPKEVIDVTNSQYFAYLGSRDEQLAPTVRMVWGIGFTAAGDIVTGFVVKAHYKQMLNNFQQNGRVALSYSDSTTHVAYQLKGHFLQARPLTEEEAALQQQYRREIINFLTEFAGFSRERLSVIARPVDLAIDLKVEKIFNQTPGPGAGKEITF
jgi:hypothetical protein